MMRSSRIIQLLAMAINVVMVISVYFAVINELLALAFVILLLSKWRVVATQPRFWLRNLINNSCDILFGASTVSLMYYYQEQFISQSLLGADTTRSWLVLGLAVVLLIWQLLIKPRSSDGWVAIQSAGSLSVAQLAIWTYYPQYFDSGLLLIVLSTTAAFIAGYHYARQTDEYEGRIATYMLLWSSIFAMFGWLGWLWNVQYVLPGAFLVPQIVLSGGITGYYLATLVAINARSRADRRTQFLQQSGYYGLLMLLIIFASRWGSVAG